MLKVGDRQKRDWDKGSRKKVLRCGRPCGEALIKFRSTCGTAALGATRGDVGQSPDRVGKVTDSCSLGLASDRRKGLTEWTARLGICQMTRLDQTPGHQWGSKPDMNALCLTIAADPVGKGLGAHGEAATGVLAARKYVVQVRSTPRLPPFKSDAFVRRAPYQGVDPLVCYISRRGYTRGGGPSVSAPTKWPGANRGTANGAAGPDALLARGPAGSAVVVVLLGRKMVELSGSDFRAPQRLLLQQGYEPLQLLS